MAVDVRSIIDRSPNANCSVVLVLSAAVLVLVLVLSAAVLVLENHMRRPLATVGSSESGGTMRDLLA